MSDQDIRQLLEDTVSDVEPRRGLDEISSRTGRARRPWMWGTAGAVLATAAVIAAVSMVGGLTGANGPDVQPAPATQPELAPVYFLGDTGTGPRLFREERQVSDSGGHAAVHALQLAVDGESLDPDYRSAWPTGTGVEHVTTQTNSLVVDLAGDHLEVRPTGMTSATAQMSVQQLVYTARQDRSDSPLRVRFEVDGSPVGTLLGVQVGSVAPGPRDSTLAPVSIDSPSSAEEARVTVGSPFTVTGEASAFEANLQWELRRGGTTGPVVRRGFATAKTCCTLSPYRFVVKAPAGDYTLVVHDEDVSDGEGAASSSDTKLLRVK
jgi:hypothetical protein